MWRLNAYWRYVPVDGGVLVVCESLALSRSVPLVVRVVAAPMIDRVSRESLENTLGALRTAYPAATGARIHCRMTPHPPHPLRAIVAVRSSPIRASCNFTPAAVATGGLADEPYSAAARPLRTFCLRTPTAISVGVMSPKVR